MSILFTATITGTLGRLGVVDRLDRLGHDPVVGSHDDHRDVGHLTAAGAHRRERLVARRVEERDHVAVVAHLVGADVLGDPARLAGGDLGLADCVEKRGLAVVHVAHHRHNRRALDEVVLGSSYSGSSSTSSAAWTISTFLSNASASTSIASSGRSG